MKGSMSKFYWEDKVMYWAHRGIPTGLIEECEYAAQRMPSKKKILRLFFGRVKLAVGVLDYWLDGRVTYRKVNRMDGYAGSASAKPQLRLLDACVPAYVWFVNMLE
jgi:hypothetical protein